MSETPSNQYKSSKTPISPAPQTSSESSAAPPMTPIPLTGKIEVTVGRCYRRTWHLPKALLAQHSNYFAFLLREPHETPIQLAVYAPDFANFVDYMRSSIFSLNGKVSGFHPVEAHARAYILGQHIGALKYSDAALRSLHMNLELPDFYLPGEDRSLIRPRDVWHVCRQTGSCEALKRFFFDAVASHWKQRDIMEIEKKLDERDTVGWLCLYNMNAGFREALMATFEVPDVIRSRILRGEQYYLDLKWQEVGDGFRGHVDDEMVTVSLVGSPESVSGSGSSTIIAGEGGASLGRRRGVDEDSEIVRIWSEEFARALEEEEAALEIHVGDENDENEELVDTGAEDGQNYSDGS
ncbi:hypothetical protein GQ44DRAFT_766629 [Phaeosphaeriaceae sp. PMI808]|nr:hypothetical protein GQ44DRAFT_766629 [Phaeosphaeriaceae sp. PMI808]